MVIEAQFDCGNAMAGPFRQNLARVARNGKWSYINRAGEFVIQPQFDMALEFEFSEGLAQVTIGKRSGFINLSGETIVLISHQRAGRFSEGLAAVSIGNGEAHRSLLRDGFRK
jgi:WG containing repeat